MNKKLIEVALPLEAINEASAREKSIRHGHPSTLHLWWARRPLAAARAVIFSSLVDDPSSRPEEFPSEEAQSKERQRLFSLIEDLVKWENSNNQEVLDRAKAEILKSTGGNPPAFGPYIAADFNNLKEAPSGLNTWVSSSAVSLLATMLSTCSSRMDLKFFTRNSTSTIFSLLLLKYKHNMHFFHGKPVYFNMIYFIKPRRT